MAAKTPFSKDDFLITLSNYDLGELRRFTPIAEGTVQTNFLLETARGRYVYRYYENRSLGSVLFEADLIRYLNDKGYPCPVIFKNKDGKYAGIYNEKPFAIFEFIEGEHVESPSDYQQQQLISRVAELQILTRNYQPIRKDQRWNYSIELCRGLAQKEAERINTANAKDKLAWFEAELLGIDLPEHLPKGICHCDFHFSNILFKDGEFRALLDFDDANYTFLTYDLATLISPFTPSFDWNTWSTFSQDENVFDFSESRKVVDEYTKYRQLDRDEKEHLFDVFKLSVMFDCVWYFERGDARDFYEKRKIDYLNGLGQEQFHKELFG